QWETYKADLSVDVTKHHKPTISLDKFAYYTVKSLQFPTDIFFLRRYGRREMTLETVAAVPGMMGGMLLHLRVYVNVLIVVRSVYQDGQSQDLLCIHDLA
ncbi:alternative oxidase, partial [Tanacetum coccineum]